MHVENLKKVRDFIATMPEHKIDMDSFLCDPDWDEEHDAKYPSVYAMAKSVVDPHCGTTGCIAGYAFALKDSLEAVPPDSVMYFGTSVVAIEARQVLALPFDQAHTLFFGYREENASKEHVLKVLDICIEKGYVPYGVWDM